MGPPGRLPTLSIGRLMVGVAVVASALPALRGDEAGQRLAGALIVAECVAILAWKLSADAIAKARGDEVAIGRWGAIRVAAWPCLAALLLIGSADMMFFFVYELIRSVIVFQAVMIQSHRAWQWIDGFRVAGGLVAAVWLASWMRRQLQSPGQEPKGPGAPVRPPDRGDPDEWR